MTTVATLDTLVSEANTQTFYSLNKLNFTDISSIWDAMCLYIHDQMIQKKGVAIPGLGTFCFSMKQIFLGQKESVELSRPMFLLSNTVGPQGQKPHVSGQMSVIDLNFSSISQLAGRTRDQVMGCIKELLVLLKRFIDKGQGFLLIFNSICSIYFRNKRVKVKFFQDFLDVLGIPDNYTSRLYSPLSRGSSSFPLSDSTSSNRGETPSLPNISHTTSKPPQTPTKPTFAVTNTVKSPSKLYITTTVNSPPSRHLSTDHRSRTKSAPTAPLVKNNQGEMCPCCEMRSARNATTPSPIDWKKKVQADENEQLKFQVEQDAAVIARDLMALAKRRKENKDVSALNWSAAEELKNSRKVRSHSTEPSYLFHSRSTTPSRYVKQHEYWTDLAHQVKDKQVEMERALLLKKETEKSDQERLSQAMVREIQLYQKQRIENARIYHDTLDYQMTSQRTKELEVKEPILKGEGVDLIELEMNRRQEKRGQAKKLYKEQLNIAEQKKQIQTETARLELKKEALKLQAIKKQLVVDREKSYREQQHKFTQLAKSWDQSIAEKKLQTDLEESELKKDYISILDQSSGYGRCKQCQRDGTNRGTSNVLHDTRYIAGSRHMT
ncbi:Coiled-coil domain-containing protein 81 [Oopsacas minuta]|uniref:Coiled-coil domain-containing protein 81 n=1 Tax=Oopsacas minuta TaxID=111878 RepID=A0AAV7JXY1_9METZ|nr:Coiled-coil domain-containing protein 81 [Oopsacas minuta]